MKRGLPVAFVLLLAAASLAGAASLGNIRGGPRLGFVMSTWTGSDANKLGKDLAEGLEMAGYEGCGLPKEWRRGVSVGGFLRYDINQRFAVQPEAYFILKGIKYSGGCYYEGYRIDMDFFFNANYFQFPVLGVLKVGAPENANFNLLAGPYLAFNAGSGGSVKTTIQNDSEKQDSDYENINTLDAGMIFGAGITHPTGIVADFRYSMGFRDVHDAVGMPDVRHVTYQITAGYMF
jgi:hypothetical protein